MRIRLITEPNGFSSIRAHFAQPEQSSAPPTHGRGKRAEAGYGKERERRCAPRARQGRGDECRMGGKMHALRAPPSVCRNDRRNLFEMMVSSQGRAENKQHTHLRRQHTRAHTRYSLATASAPPVCRSGQQARGRSGIGSCRVRAHVRRTNYT